MLITEFLAALETVVPLANAGYARDAIGLQVGLPRLTELTTALFAYEVTEEVIAEAKQCSGNLIVAFHPLIFPSVDAITDATRTGELITQLIRSEIALYVQHTAFDTHPEFGTSRLMAEALGLEKIRILSPLPQKPEAGKPLTGMGVIGSLGSAITQVECIRLVQNVFGTPCVRSNEFRRDKKFSNIAMVGGAGMEFYSAALRNDADVFITADVRYHDFYRASHDGVLLIDAGHAETEKFVTQGMIQAARASLQAVLNFSDEPRNAVILQTGLPQLVKARTEPNAVRYHLRSQP